MRHSIKIRSHIVPYTSGLCSDINNGKHILMLDYDDRLTPMNLKKELRSLIKKFRLGNLEIYESSHNHFVVIGFYEQLSYMKLIEVIYNTNCDPQFKMWRMVRECAVIRYDKKYGSNILRPISYATLKGFRKPLPSINKKMRDYFNNQIKEKC